MSILNKAYVKMTPTNDMGAPICRFLDSGRLAFKSTLLAYHTNQHVHLLSDEPIIDGDNFIVGERVVKAITRDGSLGYDSINEIAFLWIQPHHRKIIATTDTSLTYKEYLVPGEVGRYFTNKRYPSPSDVFLQGFCDANGDITEVLVEFEKILCTPCHSHCSSPEMQCNKYALIPVTEDGDVIIKPLKTSWTREEVMSIREEAFYKGFDYANDEMEDGFNREKYLNNF